MSDREGLSPTDQPPISSFPRFSGAAVYATSVQDTGFMLVANLRVGVRYFEAQSLQTEDDRNIKTSVLISVDFCDRPIRTGIISRYVKSQDVVTP